MAPFSIHLEPLGGSRYKYLKLPSRDWDGNPPNENVGIHASLMLGTLPETNMAPEDRPGPKRKLIFQPSIFRCYFSFREGSLVGVLKLIVGFVRRTIAGREPEVSNSKQMTKQSLSACRNPHQSSPSPQTRGRNTIPQWKYGRWTHSRNIRMIQNMSDHIQQCDIYWGRRYLIDLWTV